MAAADYRLITEATGQRIAAALESLVNLGDPVTIAHGGTGASTAAAALAALGGVAVTDIVDNLTKNESKPVSSGAVYTALDAKIQTRQQAATTINLDDLDNGIAIYGSSSSNIPSSGHGGTVLTMRNNYNSQGLQIAQANNVAGFYYRNLASGVWGSWVQV